VSETVADRHIKRLEQLASNRSNFDVLFQQVAERVLPGEAQFLGPRTPGEDRQDKLYDATGALALRKYAAILESLGMPRTAVYHTLKPADESLEEDYEVKGFFEELNKLIFRRRYAPHAGFTGALGTAHYCHGSLGNASLFVDEVPGRGIRYRAIPLSESYYAENHVGIVDTLYRRFQYSARQAASQWPKSLPPQINTALEKNPDQMFWFIHATLPVDEAQRRRYPAGAKFASTWICQDFKSVLEESHYFSWPYPTMRDVTLAGEVYARGPAVWVLPTLKTLNEMKRTIVRAGQKAVDPPLMLTEDGALQGFNLRPGALNGGALNDSGEELVKPFNPGARVDIGVELMEIEQRIINDSFYVTLLQVVVDHPQMTATESLQRAQEQGMLLGPVIGRQQEFLGQLVEREIDLLARSGELPPMPEVLLEAGGEYKIEYDGPLTRIQRSGESLAVARTLETVGPLAAVDPSLLDNYDTDQIARDVAQINGMPVKQLRDPKAVAELRAKREQTLMAQQAAEQAPGIAKAAKDAGLTNAA